MGKVKKAKKFRKNHLKDKIDKVRQKQKVTKALAKKQSKAPLEKAPGFQIEQPKASLIEDPELEVQSGSDSENDGEMADLEQQEYLNGIDASDLDDMDEEAENEPENSDELTKELVASWSTQLKSPQIIKKIIQTFAKEEETLDLRTQDALTNLALGPLPGALKEMLPLNKNHIPVGNKKLRDLDGVLNLYCRSLGELLKNGTNKRTPKILAAVKACLPYFLKSKYIKTLVKSLVSVVVNPNTDDEPKVMAFSIIKEACTHYPNTLLEMFLKQTYESLVRTFKTTNGHTLPTINLAKNLFGLLYGVDASQGYQVAFQQVRTLALNLKSALDQKKNPENDIKVIYTWQYVHSLDYFSRVIALSAGEEQDAPADVVKSSPLMQLIHPLVQITLRTITLVPKPAYLPLRFFLVRSLIRLCRHTGVYVPLNPILLEVLSSSAVNRRAQKSTLEQFDFEHNIQAPESYINTQVYQNCVNDELVDLFAEVLVLYCKSIAFPEITGPVIVTLRRFMKKNNNNVRLNKQLQTFVERLEANSEFVLRHRSKVSFGPRDKEQVAAFLKEEPWEKTPLGSFAAVRRTVREERLRLLQQTNSDDENDEDLKGLDGDSDDDQSDNDEDDDAMDSSE